MKKIIVLLLLIIFPISVNAASVSVKSLSASLDNSTIKYNGEMENGSYAVMCKLLDSDDNELDYLSSAVSNHKFEGEFTIDSEGTYNIACANYEGGDFKIEEVEVKEETTEEEMKESTPNTYDNILSIVAIAGISLAILVGITLYIRKEVK